MKRLNDALDALNIYLTHLPLPFIEIDSIQQLTGEHDRTVSYIKLQHGTKVNLAYSHSQNGFAT